MQVLRVFYCVWEVTEEEQVWRTTCGMKGKLTELTPRGFNFCPFCGDGIVCNVSFPLADNDNT